MHEKINNNSSRFSRSYIRSTFWLLTDALSLCRNALWYFRHVFLVAGVLTIGTLLQPGIANAALSNPYYSVYNVGFPSDVGEVVSVQEHKWKTVWDLSEQTSICGLDFAVRLDRATSTPADFLRVRFGTHSAGEIQTTLSTTLVNPTSLSDSFSTTTIEFTNGCEVLDPDIDYVFYFDLEDDGAGDNSNYYQISRQASNSVGYTTVYEYGSAVWNSIAAEISMVAYGFDNPFYLDIGAGLIGTTTLNKITFTNWASTSLPIIPCDEGGNFFSSTTLNSLVCHSRNAGVEFVRFMIIPPDALLDYFNNTIDGFKDIFPFSVIYNSLDVFYGATQQTIVQPTITHPQLIHNGREIVPAFTIISSTTISDLMGETNYNSMRSIMDNVIWLSVGLGIFMTIRRIGE